MSKHKEPDVMDGAYYAFAADRDKTPEDYYADAETGIRPGEKKPPVGDIKVFVDRGIKGKTLPPKAVWAQGHWKATNAKDDLDFHTWVVSGEGTPGNYKERHYVVPGEIAKQNQPRHPSQWSKKLREDVWTYGGTKAPEAPALPFGLRFRCIGCGHWYKESDLAGHVKNCCPGTGETDWAIACECCLSLDDTAQVKAGFPRPPKIKPSDMSEKEGKDDNGKPVTDGSFQSAPA